MVETWLEIYTSEMWWGLLLRIGTFYFLAWAGHRVAGRLAGRLMRLHGVTPRHRPLRAERQETLQSLLASAITFLAFTVATLASLNQFVGVENLIWMVGLFSAAFGLGARPVIADFLTGVSFIFEDTFDVGEKVEILDVAGVIESVNLRTTFLRAPSGELYVIPNGEVRMVRNFSRGRYSLADITIKLPAADLGRALPLLEELAQEAVILLPNLLEPWHVISESGVIGLQTELKLVTKARFGRAAEMRPRLLALVQERLAEAGVQLAE